MVINMKKTIGISLDVEMINHMKRIRINVGVPISIQVQRALEEKYSKP